MDEPIAGPSSDYNHHCDSRSAGSESAEEYDPETEYANAIEPKPINMSPGALQLRSWLNKSLRIQMSDGRVLIGVFLCTDRDANVILGSCSEYLPESEEEPRMLGLVMIPGKHIVTVHINVNTSVSTSSMTDLETPLDKNVCDEDVM